MAKGLSERGRRMMQNGNPILRCKRLSVGKLSTHTSGHSGCMHTVCPAVSITVRVLLSPDNEVACPESSHIPRLGFLWRRSRKGRGDFILIPIFTEATRHVRTRSHWARTVLSPSQPSLARFPAAFGSEGGRMSETVQCLEFQ